MTPWRRLLLMGFVLTSTFLVGRLGIYPCACEEGIYSSYYEVPEQGTICAAFTRTVGHTLEIKLEDSPAQCSHVTTALLREARQMLVEGHFLMLLAMVNVPVISWSLFWSYGIRLEIAYFIVDLIKLLGMLYLVLYGWKWRQIWR